MSELDDLYAKRRGLQSRVAELRGEVGEIDQKLKPLELEESRAKHPCSCVRLNSDIVVNDMGAAEAMRRRTFGVGLVAELLSADRDCPKCAGTGVPKEKSNKGLVLSLSPMEAKSLDELNTTITGAIMKAEALSGGTEESRSAYRVVAELEIQIAALTDPDSIEGRIARRGIITAEASSREFKG